MGGGGEEERGERERKKKRRGFSAIAKVDGRGREEEASFDASSNRRMRIDSKSTKYRRSRESRRRRRSETPAARKSSSSSPLDDGRRRRRRRFCLARSRVESSFRARARVALLPPSPASSALFVKSSRQSSIRPQRESRRDKGSSVPIRGPRRWAKQPPRRLSRSASREERKGTGGCPAPVPSSIAMQLKGHDGERAIGQLLARETAAAAAAAAAARA